MGPYRGQTYAPSFLTWWSTHKQIEAGQSSSALVCEATTCAELYMLSSTRWALQLFTVWHRQFLVTSYAKSWAHLQSPDSLAGMGGGCSAWKEASQRNEMVRNEKPGTGTWVMWIKAATWLLNWPVKRIWDSSFYHFETCFTIFSLLSFFRFQISNTFCLQDNTWYWWYHSHSYNDFYAHGHSFNRSKAHSLVPNIS